MKSDFDEWWDAIMVSSIISSYIDGDPVIKKVAEQAWDAAIEHSENAHLDELKEYSDIYG